MGIDSSYGSGKPRSAANSSARRRVAAGQLTKSKKSPAEKIKAGRARMAASPLGQLADTLFGFALPMGKVESAARGLRAAGKIGQATALEARVAAKAGGKIYGGLDQGLPINTSIDVGSNARRASESLYPKLPSRGGDEPSLLRGQRDLRTFDKYADLINERAGRFARGTSRGNKLVKAIEKNEVQQGFYIGSREAIKRAAFNSKRGRSNLPKAK